MHPKTWKMGNSQDQLAPNWNGPHWVILIIHPALTKTIEKKFNKGFMHFSGFVLGKGLRVETEIMAAMIEDRKTLDRDAFLRKYYYKP